LSTVRRFSGRAVPPLAALRQISVNNEVENGTGMKNRLGCLFTMLLVTATVATPVMADEADEVRSLRDTTIALVKLLVQQGVLTQEKADELIRKAEEAGRKSAAPGAQANATGQAGGSQGSANSQAQLNSAGQPNSVAQSNTPAGPNSTAPASGATPAAPGQPPVVRVPYVPETVKQEIRDEVKQDVLAQAKQERWGEPGALPDWLNRISFAGDVRFRGQADRYPTSNVPNATPEVFTQPQYGAYDVNNTSDPRNRMRLRVRFGAEAHLGTVTAALRLTTGSAGTGGDPSTENENLGNYNARGTVGFDRAYISYRPTSWLYFTGGRLGNPFFSPTTLVWGDDLSLQGLLGGLTPTFGSVKPFAIAGLFPIQDIEPTPLTSARTKWLFAYQAGFTWQAAPIFSWKLAAALYDYRRMEGVPNQSIVDQTENLTAAVFRQKGNSVFDINGIQNTYYGTQNYLIGLASKFNEENISTSLDLVTFARKHLILDGDYVTNIGFNQGEIFRRTSELFQKENKGWQAKLTFGDVSFERRNSWQGYVGFRHVESDAVVDAFTDADFHLGGTNATGYYLGATYAFERNSTIGVRWFSAKQISGYTPGQSALPLAIDVLQIDAIARF
jgi:Putative porin